MEINKVHNIDFLNNTLPDKCANLIIADPPYYKVKGDFDFIWKTFDDYLKDVEKWAIECKRILADNGTLLWYGDNKNIAYSQIIMDKYFKFNNNLIWYKKNLEGGMFGSVGRNNLRSFPICTERILMYSNNLNYNSSQNLENNIDLFKPIKDYFLDQKKKSSYTFKQINQKCFKSASNGGGMASNILTSYKKGWVFPTKEKYEALQKIGLCPKPYDKIKTEYENLRRPFSNSFKLNEVLQFDTNRRKKYKHDTVKPEKLTRTLILTCSRQKDLVVVPFAGSGTECAMSLKENRKFIGFELIPECADMSNNRVQEIAKQTEFIEPKH